MDVKLSRVVADAVFSKKGFERRPDILFALDLNGLEVRFLDLGKKLDHAAAVVPRPQRFDLAVAKRFEIRASSVAALSAAGLSDSKLSPSEQ